MYICRPARSSRPWYSQQKLRVKIFQGSRRRAGRVSARGREAEGAGRADARCPPTRRLRAPTCSPTRKGTQRQRRHGAAGRELQGGASAYLQQDRAGGGGSSAVQGGKTRPQTRPHSLTGLSGTCVFRANKATNKATKTRPQTRPQEFVRNRLLSTDYVCVAELYSVDL